MSWRTLRLLCACGALALGAAPACGGSASDPRSSTAGNAGHSGSGNSGGGSVARAGTAGSADPTPVPCGNESCAGVVIPIQSFVIPPCCADAKTSQCGLDSSVLASFGPTFAEACQPLAQPGTKDTACPASPATPVEGTGLSLSFPGCCRPNHTCGYQLDTIGGAFPLGLGCVDASPFLDGEPPQPCGDDSGAAGAGGDNGLAGAGGDSNAAGAAGDSSAAGAAGDSSAAGAGGDFGSGGTGG